jgi:hypothetical protein
VAAAIVPASIAELSFPFKGSSYGQAGLIAGREAIPVLADQLGFFTAGGPSAL